MFLVRLLVIVLYGRMPQKNDTKHKTSETINRIIPHGGAFVTIFGVILDILLPGLLVEIATEIVGCFHKRHA